MVLTYHRILPEPSFNPFRTIISVGTFENQLEKLTATYEVSGLGAAIESERHSKSIRVAITFDDGCEDNYQFALPILKKRGLSATFCVVTNFVEKQQPLWDWEIMCRLYHEPDIHVKIGSSELFRMSNESPSAFALRVIETLKQSLISDLEHAVASTATQSTNREVDKLLVAARSMSWDKVRILKENGMEIAAHSASHRSLARLPFAEGVMEIRQSKQQIENHLQEPCLHFAFPFGTVRDHTPELINTVKECGFRTCLLARHDLNVMSQDIFGLNRIDMYENTDLRYLLS